MAFFNDIAQEFLNRVCHLESHHESRVSFAVVQADGLHLREYILPQRSHGFGVQLIGQKVVGLLASAQDFFR